MYDAFHTAGHEAALGYPTTDEVTEPGGVKQDFQKATIHWNPTRGTWITIN
ncbi:LGFP repeat-containing protein [Streptomyces sp. NPDC001389]|uniref:LGFP repeat-containing protein n=1 Tax=Streptomyces sp. NPDC001389 TaxID=3364569 RepID=UPI0036898215